MKMWGHKFASSVNTKRRMLKNSVTDMTTSDLKWSILWWHCSKPHTVSVVQLSNFHVLLLKWCLWLILEMSTNLEWDESEAVLLLVSVFVYCHSVQNTVLYSISISPSVCPFVCLSITCWYFVKTSELIFNQSLLHSCVDTPTPKILVIFYHSQRQWGYQLHMV